MHQHPLRVPKQLWVKNLGTRSLLDFQLPSSVAPQWYLGTVYKNYSEDPELLNEQVLNDEGLLTLM